MVTVVDAASFLDRYRASGRLNERGIGASPGDARNVVDLLVDQVELADVIVLNKTDLVDDAELGRLTGVLEHLNPGAELVRAEHGRVPLSLVLDTGRFDSRARAPLGGLAAGARRRARPGDRRVRHRQLRLPRAPPLRPAPALAHPARPGAVEAGPAQQGLLLDCHPPGRRLGVGPSRRRLAHRSGRRLVRALARPRAPRASPRGSLGRSLGRPRAGARRHRRRSRRSADPRPPRRLPGRPRAGEERPLELVTLGRPLPEAAARLRRLNAAIGATCAHDLAPP